MLHRRLSLAAVFTLAVLTAASLASLRTPQVVAPLAAQPNAAQAPADLSRSFGRNANANAGHCNPRGDADIRACLVPGADAMADREKPVAPGLDCFWRKDGTKRFEDVAGNGAGGRGTAIPFRFIVFNKCAKPIEVQFTLAAARGASPLEFSNCAGTVFTQVLAAGGAPVVRTCVSLPYRAGTETFTRSFSIGGRAPGVGKFVLYDPEVVIEEGRAP